MAQFKDMEGIQIEELAPVKAVATPAGSGVLAPRLAAIYQEDWTAFATGDNGAGQAVQYGEKIEVADAAVKKLNLAAPAVA